MYGAAVGVVGNLSDLQHSRGMICCYSLTSNLDYSETLGVADIQEKSEYIPGVSMLVSSYNSLYVLFSLIVAILASYTALNMAGRVTRTKGKVSALWLAGGSFAMGIGIWSMHFIGMLAFQLPIELGYSSSTSSQDYPANATRG